MCLIYVFICNGFDPTMGASSYFCDDNSASFRCDVDTGGEMCDRPRLTGWEGIERKGEGGSGKREKKTKFDQTRIVL